MLDNLRHPFASISSFSPRRPPYCSPYHQAYTLRFLYEVRTLARIPVPDVRALMLTNLRRLSAAPSTGSALRSSSYHVPHSYSHATSLRTFHTLESPKYRLVRAAPVLDPSLREGDFFRCLLVLLRQRESLKRDGTFCCRVAAVCKRPFFFRAGGGGFRGRAKNAPAGFPVG